MHADEAYGGGNPGAVFSPKQLKRKSTANSPSNLEDRETLAGRDGAADADVGRPAIIMYTSGSTGTPKGTFAGYVTDFTARLITAFQTRICGKYRGRLLENKNSSSFRPCVCVYIYEARLRSINFDSYMFDVT